MLNNPTKMLFLMTLMSGTLISTSATSWFGAWMGLEINLLSFIPLMMNSKNMFSTEASLKYFLTQALASTVLLFSVLSAMLLYSVPSNLLMPNPFMSMLISSTLLLKMGAAPFHFWFPGVMEGLNWMNSLILMTWQKIAPLMLLSYNLTMGVFTSIIIILSVLIGSIGGFNQTSLRKILAYSSINHLGWLVAAMLIGENIWYLYFTVYSYLSMTIIVMANSFNIFHVNQIFSLNNLTPLSKFALFTSLLSLGGLPPFLGFLPKWIVIQTMTQSNMIFTISSMVVMTLITLFYYLRMGFSAFLLTYTQTQWNYSYYQLNSMNYFMLLLAMGSILGLFISPILFTML
uniref:NADH-ubiquinone oxidoreductase chain 2 n=1 Tax=Scopura longa TaxID=2508260 RepID=A0A410PAH9_9NEOP|nr:NADH dehydrogenase subunit 2 [Scopura longa]QAT19796.1 NADH dehydrogenase subunit 2 [Scopura longa]